MRVRLGVYFAGVCLLFATSASAEPGLNDDGDFSDNLRVGDATIPGTGKDGFDANGGFADGGFDSDTLGDTNSGVGNTGSGLIDGRFSTAQFGTISLRDQNGNRVQILAARNGTFFDANGIQNFTFFDNNGQRITIRRINGRFVDQFGFFVRAQNLGNGVFELRSFDANGNLRRIPTVNGVRIRPFVVNRNQNNVNPNPVVNNPPTSPQLQNVQLRPADPNNRFRFQNLRRFTDPTTGREFLAARDTDGKFKPLRLTPGSGNISVIDDNGVEKILTNRGSVRDIRDQYTENQFNFPSQTDRQLVSDVLNGPQIRALNNNQPIVANPPGTGVGSHGGGGTGTGTGRPIDPSPPPAGAQTKFDQLKAEFQDTQTKRPQPLAVRDAIKTENQRNGSTSNSIAKALTCFNAQQKDQPKQMLLYLYRDIFQASTSGGATTEFQRLSFQFSFGAETDVAKAMADARPRAVAIPESSPGSDSDATKVTFNNAANTVGWEFNFKQSRGSTDPLDQTLWIKKFTPPGSTTPAEILYCKRQ